MSLEKIIFTNLLNNEEYTRKVIPFLKSEYFQDATNKLCYELIDDYIQKYNSRPTKEALIVDLNNKNGVNQTVLESLETLINDFTYEPNTSLDWLITETEKFCVNNAVYNGIMQSIQILNDKDDKFSKGSIPSILTDALSVSFDNSIGHDWFEDASDRYDLHHNVESRVRFGVDILNRITKGGLPKKTLTVLLAGVHVGKTLSMCSMAGFNLTDGKNVLYITLEMSEEEISRRIDANLLDIELDDLDKMPKELFMSRVAKVKEKTIGKLIVKEYPTSAASVANFRVLLQELRIKKNFIPDIIYIDYINLCSSYRMKQTSNVNSYTYVKAIAEEIRGFAVESNLPIVSATQLTRTGSTSSDPGMEDTSESFGLPATVDGLFALISSEELDKLNQIMVKQLKNRYNGINYYKKFVVGVKKGKMRWYDVDEAAQNELVDDSMDDDYDTPLADKTTFGKRDSASLKEKFRGFK